MRIRLFALSVAMMIAGACAEAADRALVVTCAEAGAIAAMVATGETRITEIAIVGLKSNPCYPCGACRQRIFEFSDAATRVHLRDGANGEAITHTIDALLPHAFGPRDLA